MCESTPSDDHPLPGLITEVRVDTKSIYSAEACDLQPAEATSWLDAFLRCASAEGCQGLEEFLLPTMLAAAPSPLVYSAPPPAAVPRQVLSAALRADRAAWASRSFVQLRPPVLRPLPGARWELNCKITQSGTRPDGRKYSARRPLRWYIELVFTEGRWQALRAAYADRDTALFAPPFRPGQTPQPVTLYRLLRGALSEWITFALSCLSSAFTCQG